MKNSLLSLLSAAALVASPAFAATVTWSAGTPDAATGNWNDLSFNGQSYTSADTLEIDGLAKTITVANPVTAPVQTNFISGNAVTITGGSLGGILSKSGTGSLTLSSANSFTSLSITGGPTGTGSSSGVVGSIIVTNAGALGSGQVTFGAINNGRMLGFNFGAGSGTITNNISLGSATGIITLDAFGVNGSVATSSKVNLAGTVSGTSTGTLWLDSSTTNGGGVFRLSGTNTFSVAGGITVNRGVIAITSDASLGAAGNVLTLFQGGSTGALRFDAASINVAHNIAVTGFCAFDLNGDNNGDGTVDSINNATVSGVISGGSALTVKGGGTLTLTGANTYTGTYTVSAGTLAVGGSGVFGNRAGLSVAGGTLDLGGTTQVAGLVSLSSGTIQNGTLRSAGFTLSGGTIAGSANLVTTAVGTKAVMNLQGAGSSTLNAVIADGDAVGSSAINVSANAASGATSVTFADTSGLRVGQAVSGTNIAGGTIINAIVGNTVTLSVATTGALTSGTSSVSFAAGSSAVSVNKTAAGSWTLTGANTYTGGTTVAVGTLVTGNTAALGAGSGAVSVSSGAILQIGNGTVNTVTLGTGANLAINGTLKLGSLASVITLTGTGGYTFNGTLDLAGLFNNATAGNYTLISGGSGTKTDTSVTIANFTSSNGLVASFSQGVLSLQAVPEPSTYGLVGAGALAAVAMVRRRRKVK